MEADEGEGARPGSLQSVDRAVDLLEVLATSGEMRVGDLARALGCHKSTASRLVAALARRQLVVQASEGGPVRLGFGVVRLAGAVAARLDVAAESRAACERLALGTGESVTCAVLDGDAAVAVAQAVGPSAISATSWTGRRTPLHATASGKVLLAFAAPPLRARLMARPRERLTDATVTSARTLTETLQGVRAQGWARVLDEMEVGLAAVAVPVHGPGGEVVAAVSVAGPSFRLDEATVALLLPDLLAEAEEIGRRLGGGAP